jgi:hypothetical protein
VLRFVGMSASSRRRKTSTSVRARPCSRSSWRSPSTGLLPLRSQSSSAGDWGLEGRHLSAGRGRRRTVSCEPKLRAILLAFFLAAVITACDWGNEADSGAGPPSGEATTSTAEEPTIESSLEALAVLPPRIRWSATTSLPPAQVEMMQFFVDGSRWWDDPWPPYTYGPPGAYLPARWISSIPKRPSFRRSRMHDFMVRVKTTDGEKLEGVVVRLRTPKATLARPPGGFGNDIYRTHAYVRLSESDIASPLPPGSYPAGTGYLVFIGSSLFVGDGKHTAAWELSGDREQLRFGMPIFFRPGAYAAVGSGFYGVTEVVCGPNAPAGRYAWSQTTGRVVSSYGGVNSYARNLELRSIKDPCEPRRRLLEGIWESQLPD